MNPLSALRLSVAMPVLFRGACAALAVLPLGMCEGFAQSASASAAAPADRAAVLEAYGPPAGTMRAGDREILTYPERKIVIVDGRVVSSTPTTPAPRPTPTPAPAFSSATTETGATAVPTPAPLQPARSGKTQPTPMPTRYYPPRPTQPPSPAELLVQTGQNFIQAAKGSARLCYDPQAWTQLKSPNADMRALSHRSANLHVVMNVQAGNFSLSDPASMLLARLRAREPQALVLRQEKRNVTGGEITFLRALGSPAPSRVEYVYYVHCGVRFASIVMVLGPQTECEQHGGEIAKLLDGFEIPEANAEASPL